MTHVRRDLELALEMAVETELCLREHIAAIEAERSAYRDLACASLTEIHELAEQNRRHEARVRDLVDQLRAANAELQALRISARGAYAA